MSASPIGLGGIHNNACVFNAKFIERNFYALPPIKNLLVFQCILRSTHEEVDLLEMFSD
jgi:hypothetical protein